MIAALHHHLCQQIFCFFQQAGKFVNFWMLGPTCDKSALMKQFSRFLASSPLIWKNSKHWCCYSFCCWKHSTLNVALYQSWKSIQIKELTEDEYKSVLSQNILKFGMPLQKVRWQPENIQVEVTVGMKRKNIKKTWETVKIS